jgi:hypothetical protein
MNFHSIDGGDDEYLMELRAAYPVVVVVVVDAVAGAAVVGVEVERT